MEFVLPPTEEPFGPSCSTCELFTRGECLGVSTVRVVVGAAQAAEEAASNGLETDLSVFQQPSVRRSFRILERTLRYCPGPGNDGRGDFRKSDDRVSGYVSASIIKTALAQIFIPQPQSTQSRLISSGHSFSPAPRPHHSEGREEQRY